MSCSSRGCGVTSGRLKRVVIVVVTVLVVVVVVVVVVAKALVGGY